MALVEGVWRFIINISVVMIFINVVITGISNNNRVIIITVIISVFLLVFKIQHKDTVKMTA